MSTPNVSLLGVGRMGEPIARRLLTGLGELTVWNRTASKMAAPGQAGGNTDSPPSPRTQHHRQDLGAGHERPHLAAGPAVKKLGAAVAELIAGRTTRSRRAGNTRIRARIHPSPTGRARRRRAGSTSRSLIGRATADRPVRRRQAQACRAARRACVRARCSSNRAACADNPATNSDNWSRACSPCASRPSISKTAQCRSSGCTISSW